VEGRSGIAGAEVAVDEVDKAEDCGVAAEKPVEDATEDDKAGELVAGQHLSTGGEYHELMRK
jgi:hypothetical protein